jgi:hypothetical protein
MPNCSTCGIELQVSTCPNCGGTPLPSAGGARVLYILLLIPGVFVSLSALSAYPPLDARRMMGFLLCAFLLPVLLQVLSIVLKRPSDDMRWSRPVYFCSSLALVLLGLLLFLNGGLDRSASNEVRTTVVRKTAFRGRRGTQYHLFVSSWRPGGSLEDFSVVLHEYNRAVVGRTVTVELHKGFFGLPWRGNISPD